MLPPMKAQKDATRDTPTAASGGIAGDSATASTFVANMPGPPQVGSLPGRVLTRALVLLNLEGEVVSANGVAIKAMGVEESGFLGKPLANLVERPAADKLKQYFDRALRGSTVKCVVRLKNADPSGPPIQMRFRLHVAGPNCSLEASWETEEEAHEMPPLPESEVAARQAAFETLFQAYLELQETNKQKTSMVASATHELKTPLAVISGSCELLLGAGLGPLNQQQREIVQLCQQNCRRLLNVVNSFLDYSAVERGKLSLMFEQHDPADMITDTARYWKRLAQSRGVNFEFVAAGNLHKVKCDRAKLQNVLNSLCDNALKYTPSGGRVTLIGEPYFWERRLAEVKVSVERRVAAEEADVNAIRFSVIDTGPGIQPEYHQDIFEEYFQVPGSVHGGMGLGLAIARKIVSAHKGKIWVESRPGNGTAFHFVIPVS